MKILWLELAEEDLESIYQFYAKDKSIKAANKIYNDILDATDSLALSSRDKSPTTTVAQQDIDKQHQ